MRALGFLLLGMGTVLCVTMVLGLAGIIPLQVGFFGVDLDTSRERLVFALGSAVAAGAGLLLVRMSSKATAPSPSN